MPVRITNRGAVLNLYNEESNSWESSDGMILRCLTQYVEISPDVTLERIFKFVEASHEIRVLIEGIYDFDIHEAMRRSPGIGGADLGFTPEYLEVSTIAWYFTDDRTDSKRIRTGHLLLLATDEISGGFGRELSYCDLKDYVVRLHTEMRIDDLHLNEDEEPLVVAEIQYTLFDVLIAVFSHFGKPIDHRFQDEVQTDIDVNERLRGGDGDEFDDENEEAPHE